MGAICDPGECIGGAQTGELAVANVKATIANGTALEGLRAILYLLCLSVALFRYRQPAGNRILFA